MSQRHLGCGELHANFSPGSEVKDQARSRKNWACSPRTSTPCALDSLINGSRLVSLPGHQSLKHIFKRKRKQAKHGEEVFSHPLPGPPCGQSLLSVALKGAHSESASLPRHCLATVVSTQAAFVQATACVERHGLQARKPPSQPKGSRNLFPNKEKTHGEGLGPSLFFAV